MISNSKVSRFKRIWIVPMLFLSFSIWAADWPGTGSCAGSLQACIDAQPNSGSVIIKTNSVIAETMLTIDKGLFLSAGTGFKPIFRNMEMEINVPADKKVTVQKFQFELSSTLFVRLSENSEINILSNTWSNPSSIFGEMEGVTVWSNSLLSGMEYLVNIKQNTFVTSGYNASQNAPIKVAHYNTGLMQVNIHDNHITNIDSSPDINSRLLEVDNINDGTLDVQVVANTMRGAINQIKIRQALTSGATMNFGLVSNLITGVIDKDTVVDANPINTALISNVSTGNFTGIIGNNTIDGVKRSTANVSTGFNMNDHTTTGSSSISLLNNIIVNTNIAYSGPTSGTSSSITSEGNNIFFNHGSLPGLSLVSSDLNQPPLFKEEGVNYALKSNSFAVDIVSSTGASLLYGTGFMTGSPSIDADGLRRYKGSRIDAGAYEWGDRHIFRKVTEPHPLWNNVTHIGDQDLDNDSSAVTITTQVWNYLGDPGVSNNQSIGVYRENSEWNIFNQNTSADMPLNAKFHVYYPYGSIGNNLNGLAVYRAIDDSVTGFELDDLLLNNNPTAGVFATNLWDISDGGVYNNHPIELGYQTSNDKWYLNNADGTNMPLHARFNLYSQDGSRNVFHHEVSAENTPGNTSRIDHPLLDNNPCALPMVTQSTTWFFGPVFGQNPNNIGVYYYNGHWRIINQNFENFELPLLGDITGGRFNVMVDPQQVYQCNKDDLIFKDSFE